jgi:hypothetical protein
MQMTLDYVSLRGMYYRDELHSIMPPPIFRMMFEGGVLSELPRRFEPYSGQALRGYDLQRILELTGEYHIINLNNLKRKTPGLEGITSNDALRLLSQYHRAHPDEMIEVGHALGIDLRSPRYGILQEVSKDFYKNRIRRFRARR